MFGGDADLYRKLGSPDVCIHLAWRDGFRHNSAAHMKDLSSHVTFLNTLIDGGLKDLSVMGTMHEVGYWEGAINEDVYKRQNKSRVLMVGDDLLADIKGGLNAGVDTCWFNPGNLENKSGITPKYTVSSYEELYRIVMEPEELENIGVRNRRHSNEALL